MLFIIWFFSFRIIIIFLEFILHMNLRNFKFELSHYKVWMVYSLQTAVLWSHDKSAHDKALEYFACVIECLQSIVSFFYFTDVTSQPRWESRMQKLRNLLLSRWVKSDIFRISTHPFYSWHITSSVLVYLPVYEAPFSNAQFTCVSIVGLLS